MSLSANTVIEVRLTGSDTNGGGFVAGASGTDWSQQDTPQYSGTSGAANGTTTFTDASASFGADVVGNLVRIAGGSGSLPPGWYQIISRTGTTLTLDRSPGTSTGCTYAIGGALASPGQAAAVATVTGMIVYIKYNDSPYIATAASTNQATGCVSGTQGTFYIGYDTVRSPWIAQANRPTFKINNSVNSATLFGNLNSYYAIQSIILDGNAQTGSACAQSSAVLFNVKAMNATIGLRNNSDSMAVLCEVSGITGTTAAPLHYTNCYYCVSHDNTLTSAQNFFGGIGSSGQGSMMVGCVSYNNNCHGYANVTFAANCIAYGNALQGFDALNTGPAVFMNCISENNAGFGYRSNTVDFQLINCAQYNNSARVQAGGKLLADLNPINGSGSFFNNAAGADFTINNTGGAGALLRAAAFPTTMLGGLSNNADIGPLQHQDAGGGGSGGGLLINPGMRGGMI